MEHKTNAAKAYLERCKREYIAKLDAYIRLNNEIISLLEKAKNVISSFNGKVFNQRLINTLEKKLFGGDSEKYGCAYFTISQSGREKGIELILSGDWREFRIDGRFAGYLSLNSVFVAVLTSDDTAILNDRIDATKVNERIDMAINVKREAVRGYTDAKDNFDKYCAMSAEIEEKIDEYWNNVPSCIRLYITVKAPSDF